MKKINLPGFFRTGVLLFLIWSLNSCTKEFPEDPLSNLHPTFATAAAYLDLTLDDVIEVGDSLIYQDDDGLLRFVYRNDSIFSYSVPDVLKIPDQDSFSRKFDLGQIQLNDFGPMDKSITLDSIVQTINPVTAATIMALDGTTSDMPGMAMIAPETYDLGSTDNFLFVTFSQGYLVITIQNNLPVTFSQLSVTLQTWYNTNTFDLGSMVFQNLLPNVPQTDSIDLTGKTVWKNFKVRIDDFSTLPQTGVFIDLSQGLAVSVYSSQVKVSSGIAYLSQQLFGSGSQNIEFKVDQEEQLHQLSLVTGAIQYEVTSSIATDLLVKLTLPTLLVNGQPATHFFALGSAGTTSGQVDVSNGLLTLTNSNQPPYNSFPINYEVSLLNSGNMIEFDQTDSIRLNCTMSDLHFSLATGTVGSKSLAIDPFFFDMNLTELDQVMGTFELTDPEIRFIVSNSIGIPVNADIHLKGWSTHGTEATLDINSLGLPYPNLVGGEVVNTPVTINNSVANVSAFLSILPSSFEISGSANTNPTNLPVMENFVTDQGYARFGIEFDLPFELKTSGLTFSDTASFRIEEEAIDYAEAATLVLVVDNGFPFDGFFEAVLLDSISGLAVDSIKAQPLQAAPVDVNGRVTGPKRSVTNIEYTKDRFERLKTCDQLVFKVKLATTGNGEQAVRIYSDYKVGLKISVIGQVGNF